MLAKGAIIVWGKLLRRVRGMPRWVSVVGIVLLLAACWSIVHAAGGTRTAWPHVFYVPIVLASLPFGVAGGIAAAVAATLLCGPLMPLDVDAGQSQDLVNWLTRGGFFVAIGSISGTSMWSLRRGYRTMVTEHILEDIERAEDDRPAQQAPSGDWFDDVARAVGGGVMHMVGQPIYSLEDGRLVIVEALARFDTNPAIPPNHWFAAAARFGLGVELEFAAVRAALTLGSDLPDGVTLSVNASPALVAHPPLLDLFDDHRGLPLMIEVTEHAIVDDYPLLEASLDRVRERGVLVAVDDAGAGFASLSHIVRLRPDVIKIDIGLSQHVETDPFRRALADALCRFGNDTDTQVVVEGIESRDDLRQWQRIGADAAQGYLLARPGPLPFGTQSDVIRPRAR